MPPRASKTWERAIQNSYYRSSKHIRKTAWSINPQWKHYRIAVLSREWKQQMCHSGNCLMWNHVERLIWRAARSASLKPIPLTPCSRTPERETQPRICAVAVSFCARYVSASVFIFWHLEQVLVTLNNKWHTGTLLGTSTWTGARHSLNPDAFARHALFSTFLSLLCHMITHVPTGDVRNGKYSKPHWPNNWIMILAKLSSSTVPFILVAQHT